MSQAEIPRPCATPQGGLRAVADPAFRQQAAEVHTEDQLSLGSWKLQHERNMKASSSLVLSVEKHLR